MQWILLVLCLLLPTTGCLAARQMIHQGLTYATDSAGKDPMREKLGEAEFRQYRAEEQNLAHVELSRQEL